MLLQFYSTAHESILTDLVLLELSMPREKVDLTTCRAVETNLACAMKISRYYKRQERKTYIKKKKSSASFPPTRPLGRGNADPPAHRWLCWNNLLVSTPSATSRAGGGF